MSLLVVEDVEVMVQGQVQEVEGHKMGVLPVVVVGLDPGVEVQL